LIAIDKYIESLKWVDSDCVRGARST